MTPTQVIEYIKNELQRKGVDEFEIEDICLDIEDEMTDFITNIMQDSIMNLIIQASEIGAKQFIDDLIPSYSEDLPTITTTTGKTDYSRNGVEMLHHLLKNGKTSKEGLKYQVIPIKNKEQGAFKNNIITSSFEAAKKINENRINSSRNRKESRIRGNPVTNAIHNLDGFKNTIIMNNINKNQEDGGKPIFRTASEKQPKNMWALPPKDMDMTALLQSTNDNIKEEINNLINNILEKYRGN